MGDFLRGSVSHKLLTLAVVLGSTIFPRLMILGGLPHTDEGFYGYQAQLAHAFLSGGYGLPSDTTLQFYPVLGSWVFAFDANPFILLRTMDLFVAAVAGWLLCRVVQRESDERFGGALIAFVFISTMNDTLFIDNGFKNSFFAAYVPLFLALGMEQKARRGGQLPAIRIGALVAFAVLLRETLVPFAAVGFVAIWLVYGLGQALRYCAGGILLGGTVIAVVIAVKGDPGAMLDSYRGAAILYSAVAERRWQLFTSNYRDALMVGRVALALAGLSFCVLVACLVLRAKLPVGRLVFWLVVIFVPLLEPATKIGYAYHFSVALPGLAGVAALGWRYIFANARLRHGALAVVILAVAVYTPRTIARLEAWPLTSEALSAIGTGTWPAKTTPASNYLIAADIIRRAGGPQRSLSIAGFMYPLYPLTGLLPPSRLLENLTATLMRFGLQGDRLREALRACPPEILMTTTRTGWPGATELSDAVLATGSYRAIAEVPEAPERSYGEFGGTVYQRIDRFPPACDVSRDLRIQ